MSCFAEWKGRVEKVWVGRIMGWVMGFDIIGGLLAAPQGQGMGRLALF